MSILAHLHPAIYSRFTSGNSVMRKTSHAFSAFGSGHAHKQANSLVEGDGRTAGVTEELLTLKRMDAGRTRGVEVN